MYQADLSTVPDDTKQDALIGAKEVIERRVNSFGVAEPLVQTQGVDRIVVELPGIKDINDAIKRIGETPILEFREKAPDNEIPTGNVNENGEIVIDPNAFWKATGLTGKNLKRATVTSTSQAGAITSGGYAVSLQFDEEGTQLFSEITKRNINQPVAIFIDGIPISQPTVRDQITTGQAEISGNFSAKDAKDLALRLNSGALPVPVKLVSQQNIGATLGQDSVNRSLVAGIIGVIIVAIFMISFYRLPGFLAVIALIVYTLISIAIFKVGITGMVVVIVGGLLFLSVTVSPWFGLSSLLAYLLFAFTGTLSPVTLTLAGIAGFVLSIGMAVDANILIFERLKEEYRHGKPIDKAIEDGFSRAWSSIRDSNISSLITCFILYQFGTPSIKGFAITLGIGVLISMFTAISITKVFLQVFVTPRLAKFPWLFGVGKEGEINV